VEFGPQHIAYQLPAPVKVHAGSAMSSGMWGGLYASLCRLDTAAVRRSIELLQPTSPARGKRRTKKIFPATKILFEHFAKIVEIIPLCVRKL